QQSVTKRHADRPASQRRHGREYNKADRIEKVEDKRRGEPQILEQDVTKHRPVKPASHGRQPNGVEDTEHEEGGKIGDDVEHWRRLPRFSRLRLNRYFGSRTSQCRRLPEILALLRKVGDR